MGIERGLKIGQMVFQPVRASSGLLSCGEWEMVASPVALTVG